MKERERQEGATLRVTLGALLVFSLAMLLAAGPAAGKGEPETARGAPYAIWGTGLSQVPDNVKVLMPDNTVRTMDMDEYVKGVVPCEMSSSWPFDALAAQAIAARSFAAASWRHPEEGANV